MDNNMAKLQYNKLPNRYATLNQINDLLAQASQKQRQAFPEQYTRYESGERYDETEDHTDQG